jgi:uncharacterized membrane protein
MADIVYLALLFIHIISIVVWMGATILFVSVLGPSMRRLNPASRLDLFKAMGPAYQRNITSSSTIAIAAGLILYAYITQVQSSLAPTSQGMPWILAGILLGLAAYVISMAVALRANRRLLELASQNPAGAEPPPQVQLLQRRLLLGGGISAILLVLALLSMVIGANL